jgi:hypothetical protein
LKLRAYEVIDVKMTAFDPEFAGKINFYLSSVDDLLRRPDDYPRIGIILCKTRERFVAYYALRDITSPSANRSTGSPKAFLRGYREVCRPLRNWRLN